MFLFILLFFQMGMRSHHVYIVSILNYFLFLWYFYILKYNSDFSMWMIFFSRLVGCPPFWHRKQMVMLRNIMEGKYSFTSPEWADISDAPKDLIRRLLVVDPHNRITIDEALNHPFFNTVVSTLIELTHYLPTQLFIYRQGSILIFFNVLTSCF